jgi:hypothetical protein
MIGLYKKIEIIFDEHIQNKASKTTELPNYRTTEPWLNNVYVNNTTRGYRVLVNAEYALTLENRSMNTHRITLKTLMVLSFVRHC